MKVVIDAQDKICRGFLSASEALAGTIAVEVTGSFEEYLYRKYENGEWSKEQFFPPFEIKVDEMELLKAKNKVLTERAEFMEDLIAEIAKKVY